MRLTEAIGDTLRTLRQDRDMTLRHLSALSRVAISHISDIERGKKQASNELLEALARGLEISTANLIGEIYDYLLEHNDEVR